MSRLVLCTLLLDHMSSLTVHEQGSDCTILKVTNIGINLKDVIWHIKTRPTSVYISNSNKSSQFYKIKQVQALPDTSHSFITGRVHLSANTGRVHLSANTGRVNLSTNTGRVHLSANTGRVHLSANTGRVHLVITSHWGHSALPNTALHWW